MLADIVRTRVWLRVPWPEQVDGYGSAVEVHYWTLAVLPALWPIILAALGWYEPRARREPFRQHAARALGASLLAGLLLAGLALFFRREVFPRMQIVLFTALLPATTLAARRITGWLGAWMASRQPRHVLIVGTGPDALRLRRLLRTASFGRSSVVGHLMLQEETGDAEVGSRIAEVGTSSTEVGGWKSDAGTPRSAFRAPRSLATGAVLGDVSRLGELLEREVIDEVFFAVRVEDLPAVLPSIRQCEEVGVIAHVLAE